MLVLGGEDHTPALLWAVCTTPYLLKPYPAKSWNLGWQEKMYAARNELH